MPTLFPDLRDELAEVAGRQAARQRRTRRQAPAAAIAVLTLAVTAALALPSGPSDRLDIVAEARAAITDGGQLIHTLTVRTGERPGAAPAITRIESWSAPDPTRWRLSFDGIQSVFRDGEVQTFRDGKLIARQPLGTNEGLPGLSALSHDAVSGLRSLLDSGQLRDAGTVEVDGRTLRRLTGQFAGPPIGPDPPPTLNVTYDVDPEDFTPVLISATGGGMTMTVRFEKFERLPLTPQNLALLGYQDPSPQEGRRG